MSAFCSSGRVVIPLAPSVRLSGFVGAKFPVSWILAHLQNQQWTKLNHINHVGFYTQAPGNGADDSRPPLLEVADHVIANIINQGVGDGVGCFARFVVQGQEEAGNGIGQIHKTAKSWRLAQIRARRSFSNSALM